MTLTPTPTGSGGPQPAGRGNHGGTQPRRDRFWLVAFAVSAAVLVLSLGWAATGGRDLGSGAVAVPASTSTLDSAGAEPTVQPSSGPSVQPSAERTVAATGPNAGRARPTWSAHPAVPDDTPADRSEPTGLSIPRLSLRIPIVPTTLEPDGQMALPDRPSEIGWYAYGPTPGADAGSAVLGGHVDSRRYGVGPLVKLQRLERGDTIVIASAQGRTSFSVTAVERISKRALPVRDLFRRTGSHELRIITCGGPYDPRSGGYRDNVVVTARPR